MIRVVKVTDGLGNQMFQYAFARMLQLKRNENVYLDIRFINNEDRIARGETSRYLEENDHRSYCLEHFRISLPVADERILTGWDYINSQNSWKKALFKLSQYGMWIWQYRDEQKWKRSRFKITDCLCFPVYFQGYYFDLKYYDDIKPILQKEFRLKEPMCLPRKIWRILLYEETVSIHIRRGDFTRLSQDISRQSYYSRAIKKLNGLVKKPIFLVFSDDIEWVKENIDIDGQKIYISDMGFADYEEFTIMKHCKHNITANSTFSYWAAYLNSNTDKIVIYPKRWEKQDIIPNGWIGI